MTENDEGSLRPGPMVNDDQPQSPRDQSNNRVNIDEDKIMERVSAKVMEGMKPS